MAITSPFKRSGHSRDNSREEQQQQRRPQQLQQQPYPQQQQYGQPYAQHAQQGMQIPRQYQPKPMLPQQRDPGAGHTRQASQAGTVASNRSSSGSASATLAQQYESDKKRLIKFCFSNYDDGEVLIDSYITHVRVIEDAAYPSSKPAAGSPASNKKPRVLVLAVKKDGTVFLHKGRENTNGSFQIGRTWSLNDLSLLSRDVSNDTGFMATLGKNYYWETSTSKERQVFVTSLVRIYRKFKNGLVPKLENWDLSIFGLDEESYKVFVNKEVPNVAPSPKKRQASLAEEPASTITPLSQATMPPPLTIPDAPPSKAKPLLKAAGVTAVAAVGATLMAAPVMTSTPIEGPTSPQIAPLQPQRRSDTKISEKTTKSEQTSMGYVSPPPPRRSMVDDALDDKLQDLAISEPQSKNSKAQEELDIPQRYEPQVDSSSSSSLQQVERLKSQESNISQSLRNIPMVAHRRSIVDPDDVDDNTESDDDITDLYQGVSDDEPASVPALTSTREQRSLAPIIITPADDDGVISFEDSYEQSFDDTNASHDLLNKSPEPFPTTTPTTIKANVQSDDEETSNDISQDVLEIPSVRGRRRAGTVNSIMEEPTAEESSFDDIFDEINWDSNDDADSLTAKLMKELANTEYEAAKKLLLLKGTSSSYLSKHTSKISEECAKLVPLFNMFAVELTGFVRDINELETEGKGLQVESINKKNLYNDLQNLFNTLAVDENSLIVLSTGDLDKDLYSLEATLSDLESALSAINGGDKNEDNLGEMYALRERRSKYESATAQFLKRLKSELDLRFQYIITQMSKYDFVNDVTFKDVLSEMLVYSGVTLFVRNLADASYFEIVGSWEVYANAFYQKVLTVLNQNLVEVALHKQKFSLITEGVVNKSSVPSIRTRSSTMTANSHDKLREKFGMLDSSSAASIPRYSNEKNMEIERIITTFQSLQKHIILHQDFVVKFFHMSSEDSDLATFMARHPIGERSSMLTSSVSEIDADRENVRDIYNVLNAVLQPGLEELLKTVIYCLRSNQRNTPPFILFLEMFDRKFASSNQEFMLGVFKKLSNRLEGEWLKFIDTESKGIEKFMATKARRPDISSVVKNFCKLVHDIEEECVAVIEFSSDKKSNIEDFRFTISDFRARQLIDDAYIEWCSTILSSLNCNSSSGLNMIRISEGGEMQDSKSLLLNDLQNTNWIIQSLSPLKLASLAAPLKSFGEAFQQSKTDYVDLMVHENFGKVASFVSDLHDLSRELHAMPANVSKLGIYSKEEVSKLLSQYTTKDITMIISRMRHTVEVQFRDPDGSALQQAFIDKLWASLQAEFVSITMKLGDTLAQHYREVELKFTKKDVIAAFSAAKP